MRFYCALALLAGCRDVPALPDARVRDDAAIDAPLDKAGACAVVFGSSLTNSFGRLDGTVRAVVPPGHPTCPMPNGTHLVLQVTMAGEAYRMVTNVLSDSGPPQVYLYELDAPLAGPAWAEGWHPGYQLDYTSTLHVTSDQFVAHDMPTTVDMITGRIELGTKISVFATSSGGVNASGAHLIHRNLTNADGAIVIGPDTATPHYMLFRFDEQAF
jgi:hypothetical protein